MSPKSLQLNSKHKTQSITIIMFNIDMTQLNGRKFTAMDLNVTYTCIGYG